MKFARGLLIFSYGLFTIAAQTLFFREFITTFEGNDISVGLFFASWFLWIGLGALLVYKAKTLAEKLLERIEFLFLGYLPAFILEFILIIQARELADIESYTLLPIQTVLVLSIFVNAPVSIITGLLFPTACRWIRQDQKLPVSRVYILEAVGSFVGGLGVTVLLGFGVSSARIFFILAFIVSLSVFYVQLARANGNLKRWRWAVVPVCVLVCLVGGADKALMQQVRIIKWTKLLPRNALRGSFQTAQAEYLYGVYRDQWIAMREGSVVETLPDESTAGRIAAIGLCQNPDAKKVLVIGSGLGLCRQLLSLPQIEDVTWTHCDNEYVQKLPDFLPTEFKTTDERFDPNTTDIRLLLANKKRYYDLVILNLPDATTSVLNRYYTVEFYSQIKESLIPDGVFAVRVAGGENIMDTELINLGASTKLTLEKVFPRLFLTPGEDTWFIASDSEKLTDKPGILRDRFVTIEGGADVFHPEALLSVYLPGRAATALENYSSADLPENLLINRDSRPLTHLYSLLLAAKQSGAPITRFVKHLALAGPLAFFIPVLVFVALRAVYILKTVRQGNSSSFESTFLVFSAGWAAIGVAIVLMYIYQTRFGSLYLHIGIISSVFMVGLTIGAVLIRRLLLSKTKIQPQILLFSVILVHTLILATIAFWPGEQWTHLIFAAAFVLCGLCAGCYFPLAARQLADSAFETGRAGSKLETADHLGASVGGLLTALALVPVLGTRITLFVFILLILANVPPAALRMYKPEKVCSLDTTAFRLRRLGYTLFGIGISVILCSNLLAAAAARLRPSLPQYAAQALAGELRLEQTSVVLPDSARKINYFKVYETQEDPNRAPVGLENQELPVAELTGYIFSSQDLAPEVRGFGGKMNLAIYANTGGNLMNFHIIRSNETPAYLNLLTQSDANNISWCERLSGRELFQPQPFDNVDAVTGATVSSEAILSALETSGHRFATQILGLSLKPGPKGRVHRASYLPDSQGVYLISAFILALIVIYYGGFWSRLAVLSLNLVVGGIILNAQYSSEQIATVLSLHTPATGLAGAFLLVIGVPLLVIIFGNIYCGYICPFGAAQELLSYIVPERFKQPAAKDKMQKARFIKYAVLLILIIVFFFSRNRTTLGSDPLISFFNLQFWQLSILLIAAIALIGSVFYTRFWCRYLCPVGAFLSLLNNVGLLKRYLPAKRFGKCEFGLTGRDQMDCLYCDRCRYQAKAAVTKERMPRFHYAPAKLLSRYFVVGVLVIAVLVSTVSVNRFLQVIPAGFGQTGALVSSGGEPRDVDLQRIRTMIRQKRLSEKEAQFYKKVE
jgi:predicted membrane-bound spermidine synthase/Na+-translocating ferredoxin:NAD+ oxidoreductase RnfG subunit